MRCGGVVRDKVFGLSLGVSGPILGSTQYGNSLDFSEHPQLLSVRANQTQMDVAEMDEVAESGARRDDLAKDLEHLGWAPAVLERRDVAGRFGFVLLFLLPRLDGQPP